MMCHMYTAAPRRAKSLIRGLRTLRTPYAKKKPSSDVSGVGHAQARVEITLL